jgi:hypothetical protein
MSGARGCDRAVALSRRVYEGLLAAYPARFRELYGEEMADLFEDVCRERLERSGPRGMTGVWSETLADLAVNSLAERARGESAITSPARLCGLLSVAGGLVAIVCGAVLPWSLLGRTGWPPTVILLELATVLLLAGSATGLAALSSPLGGRPGWRARRSRVRGLPCVGLRQAVAVTGTLLAGLTMLAAAGLLVAQLPTGGMLHSSPMQTVLRAFGYLAALGLPASAALLGVAVWRSETPGRRRALPAAVCALTCLAPAVGTAAAHAAWGLAPAAEALGMFALVGAPQIAIGGGWAALGLVLFVQGEDDGRSRSRAHARGPEGSLP